MVTIEMFFVVGTLLNPAPMRFILLIPLVIATGTLWHGEASNTFLKWLERLSLSVVMAANVFVALKEGSTLAGFPVLAAVACSVSLADRIMAAKR